MIVLSLALVIAAAVALFVGLFLTEGLAFIYIAIGLCLGSLLLLWLGTRSRRVEGPSEPSAPVYGGARPGSTTTPVRRTTVAGDDDAGDEDREAPDVEELDELTAPDVVRATSARDRAAERVAEAASETQQEPDEEPSVQVVDAPETAPAESVPPPSATAKKAAARRTTARKAPARRPTAKKATAKRATAKKATATAGTRGQAARDRLAAIPGVGPAKQDALLDHYGSLEAIREASVDDIVANVRGFGQALAARVKDAL